MDRSRVRETSGRDWAVHSGPQLHRPHRQRRRSLPHSRRRLIQHPQQRLRRCLLRRYPRSFQYYRPAPRRPPQRPRSRSRRSQLQHRPFPQRRRNPPRRRSLQRWAEPQHRQRQPHPETLRLVRQIHHTRRAAPQQTKTRTSKRGCEQRTQAVRSNAGRLLQVTTASRANARGARSNLRYDRVRTTQEHLVQPKPDERHRTCPQQGLDRRTSSRAGRGLLPIGHRHNARTLRLTRVGVLENRRACTGTVTRRAAEWITHVTFAAVGCGRTRLHTFTRTDRDDANSVDADATSAAVLADRTRLAAVTAWSGIRTDHRGAAHRAATTICITRARRTCDVVCERLGRRDTSRDVRDHATPVAITRTPALHVAAQITRTRPTQDARLTHAFGTAVAIAITTTGAVAARIRRVHDLDGLHAAPGPTVRRLRALFAYDSVCELRCGPAARCIRTARSGTTGIGPAARSRIRGGVTATGGAFVVPASADGCQREQQHHARATSPISSNNHRILPIRVTCSSGPSTFRLDTSRERSELGTLRGGSRPAEPRDGASRLESAKHREIFRCSTSRFRSSHCRAELSTERA